MRHSRRRRLRYNTPALRKANRKRARRAGHIISPTLPPRTGPGTGHVSTKRRKDAVVRREKKAQQPVRARAINAPGSPWKYIVYFHTKDERMTRRDIVAQQEGVLDFIKTALSGQYKVVKIQPWQNRKDFKIINYVKLAEESDLFSLMLCHREVVRKVFEIKAEEAQTGL